MAKPRKLEVTDEMRRAVIAEMCAAQGHQLSMANALVRDEGGHPDVGRPDPDKLAHLTCTRCDATWIVLDDVSDDYADAEEKLRGRLKDTKDIDELRKKRKPTA